MANLWEEFNKAAKGSTEPSAELRSMASANWQFYQAHVQAGFKPEEAIALLNNIMSTLMFQNKIGDGDD